MSLDYFHFLLPPLTAFLVALFLMPIMIWLARKLGFTDDPRGRDEWRRLQKKPVANGGGIILFLAIVAAILLFFQIEEALQVVLLGGLILVIFGTLDDLWELPPVVQLVPHFLVAGMVTWAGVRINFLSNPLGETLDLTEWWWLPILITIIWVVGMINTVKFLDGIDGLTAGTGIIAALMLGILSMILLQEDSQTAMLAFTLCGGLLGYLFWNWYPARIYFGEPGATMTGFLLAVLAIFSGGKIATAFLVMGLPILDVARLIIWRILCGRRPWQGGRDHLHHLLFDAGFGVRGTVLIMFLFSAVFGVSALFLQTQGKILLAFVVLLVMIVMTWFLEGKNK